MEKPTEDLVSAAEIASEFSKHGTEAVEHMTSFLERTSRNLWPVVVRFAKATALMVPEMNGQEPEAIYNCPECQDTDAHPTGYVIVLEYSRLYKREIERVAPCQRCERGIQFEAAQWLDIVEPKVEDPGSRKLKRQRSEQGWRKFNTYFGNRFMIRRKEVVLAGIRKLQGEIREPGEEG